MTGGILVAADQSIASRKVALTKQMSDVATQQTTTSTTFADLSTVGPQVTLSPGITQDHMLWYSTRGTGNSTNYTIAAPSIAGAAVVEDDKVIVWMLNVAQDLKWSNHHLATAQATGAVHTQKYRCTGGTSTFSERRMTGVAI